jgi:hypothetical protein
MECALHCCEYFHFESCQGIINQPVFNIVTEINKFTAASGTSKLNLVNLPQRANDKSFGLALKSQQN